MGLTSFVPFDLSGLCPLDVVLVLVTNVEVQVVVSLEGEIADLANERLIVDVSFEMTFDVRLGREAFAANVTVERLGGKVKAFVEREKAPHLEGLVTLVALKWTLRRMSDHVTVQVLLCFESFVAERALKIKNVAVSCFMALHVRFLYESFSAVAAFVRPFAGVQEHVAIQAEGLREVLIAQLAVMNSVAGLKLFNSELTDLMASNRKTPIHVNAADLLNLLEVDHL